MARRSSMLGGRGYVMGRKINIMLGRVSMEGRTGSMEGGRGSMEGGRGSTEGGRVSMEGGRVSMEVTNAQTAARRDSSAVGSVRTKAIKKGSTEVLPLDVLLI